MQRMIMAGCVKKLCVLLLLLAFVVLPSISLQSQNFKTLHTFTGKSDGSGPHSGLILIGNVLYGTASDGGLDSRGTVYSLITNGTEFQTVFTFPPSVGYPAGAFVIAGGSYIRLMASQYLRSLSTVRVSSPSTGIVSRPFSATERTLTE